jgi:hypothetical protein
VEKLSTLFVDKLICWLNIVDTVEKLSSLSVENFERSAFLWKMWKSYPQNMWITKQFLKSCGLCGKVILTFCGKPLWVICPVDTVENLSPTIVEKSKAIEEAA